MKNLREDYTDRRKKPEWVDQIIQSQGNKRFVFGVFEIIISLVLTSAIGMQVWMVQNIHMHSIRLTKLESSRFTQADGNHILERVLEIQAISDKVKENTDELKLLRSYGKSIINRSP